MLRQIYDKVLRKFTVAFLGIKQSVNALSTRATDDHCLTVFFDTSLMHVTYDFLWYLHAADTERKKRGLSSMQLVIVDINSHIGYENTSYREHVTLDAKRQRILDIILPSTDLFPSVKQTIIARDKDLLANLFLTPPKHRYPSDFQPALSALNKLDMEELTYIDVHKRDQNDPYRPDIQVNDSSKEFASRWIKGHQIDKPIVTITIRDMSWQTDRNSIHDNWMLLADILVKNNYCPVFIPDTDYIFAEERNYHPHLFVAPAAWNLTFRAGLYEFANLNLGVSTGPMAIPHLSRTMRYIAFKNIVPNSPYATAEAFKIRGIDVDRGFKFATSYQKFIKEGDDLERLTNETLSMLAKIKENGDEKYPNQN